MSKNIFAVLRFLALPLAALLLIFGTGAAIANAMPAYKNSVGNILDEQKIKGLYLLQQSAAQGDNLIIFGSSELRTTEISTHPANFFAGKRSGFQVNLIGRGSCQSIIHALAIAASGEDLTGKKVVLITSPQSFVPQGIEADMFAANFSPLQYLSLLEDDSLSSEVKAYLSARVSELQAQYEKLPGSSAAPAINLLASANSNANQSALWAAQNAALSPYFSFSRYLYGLKDKVNAKKIIAAAPDDAIAEQDLAIDWAKEEQAAVIEAESMTDNNDFGMLNDYYTTYIGARLERQKGRESELDYSVSKEYDDLKILFEVCRQKGIEPLFVHVPLHGEWSDYTGFTAEKRALYYQNVREITEQYGIKTLDLTANEYDVYFMCDVMHLGWKGWLAVDKALIDYYYDL